MYQEYYSTMFITKKPDQENKGLQLQQDHRLHLHIHSPSHLLCDDFPTTK